MTEVKGRNMESVTSEGNQNYTVKHFVKNVIEEILNEW